MLIVIPRSVGPSCGLADHANVIAAEASKRGLGLSLCPWPQTWIPAQGSSILLEFTPLAYSRVGLPWGLLLRVLSSRLRGGRIVTYFHELPFTNGDTWKRQFAVLLQRGFCLLLAGLSYQIVINQRGGIHWLAWLRPNSKPIFLPSCSNIGESQHVLLPSARPCQVAIFGSPGKRRHAHHLIADLGGYRKLFGANVNVLDIGEPVDLPSLLQDEVAVMGSLEPSQVLAHLLHSRFGFFYSEPYQFSKSGVFAAYCAAGVVPIISFNTADHSDYFLNIQQLTRQSSLVPNLDRVWLNCRQWFTSYSAKACADKLLHLLGDH